MKKIILLILALATPLMAQISPVLGGPIDTPPSGPSGTCGSALPMQYVYSTGVLYGCQNGTWAALATGGGGTGTVTSVSVTTANGVSGTVATATTTPAITLTLGAITPTGASTFSAAGAASTPGLSVTGAPFSGGNGTTTTPQFFVGNGTASSTWSTTGTELGIDCGSGVTNAIDMHQNGGGSGFSVGCGGAVALTGNMTIGARASFVSNVRPPNTQSGTSYVATTGDGYIFMSNTAARTVSLPQTSNAGQITCVVDTAGTAGTGNITVSVATSGTINGAASKVMSTNFAVNCFQWVSATGVYIVSQ